MKNKFKLKNFEFEAICVTGEPDQFSELKSFCSNAVQISYENATGIGDYWLIQIYDCIKDRDVVVPTGDYILKIDSGHFVLVSAVCMKEYFEIIDKYNR